VRHACIIRSVTWAVTTERSALQGSSDRGALDDSRASCGHVARLPGTPHCRLSLPCREGRPARPPRSQGRLAQPARGAPTAGARAARPRVPAGASCVAFLQGSGRHSLLPLAALCLRAAPDAWEAPRLAESLVASLQQFSNYPY
jgi:hypothetical protein